MTRCVGTALVEELDRRLLVQLRDGRKILGILRCSNAALQHHAGPVSRTADLPHWRAERLFRPLPRFAEVWAFYTSQHQH